MKYRILRNKGDALYRYLPGSLTDFADGKVIAKVSKWSSARLDVPGKRRVVERVHLQLSKFRGRDPVFPSAPQVERYNFFEPNTIELELFPLTLYSDDTGRHVRFSTVEDLSNYLTRLGKYSTVMKQRDLVHVSNNGGIESLQIPNCDSHRREGIVLDTSSGSLRQFVWRCSLCGQQLGTIGGFVEGDKVVGATPVRSASAFIPQIITLVKIAIDIEEFGDRRQLDPMILAKYLGFLDPSFDLAKGVASLVSATAPPSREQIQSLAKKLSTDAEEIARIIAAWENERKTPQEKAFAKVMKVFPEVLENPQVAISVFEFLELVRGRTTSLSSIEAEASGSSKDRFSTFQAELRSIGVADAYHIPIVPLIQAAYGYTRGDFDPQKTIIRAFPPDGMDKESRIPLYVNVTESEGILLEFNRGRIQNWLVSNGVIERPEQIAGEEKLWFLKNVSPFIQSSYATEAPPIDRQIFLLLHTTSHALIKSVTLPSGLAAESMGELFFPNVPAILLFSREGGFKTGGLYDLFMNKGFIWVETAKERLGNCVYDPVCYSSQASCHYCLITSEVTCSHFNSELSRRVLLGWEEGHREGFWESNS